MSNTSSTNTPCVGAASGRLPTTKGCRRSAIARVLGALAAVLLLASLKLPLWQMRLEAPQYRAAEALHIAVHPNALRGDLRELRVLNQYIGVHVPPTLPQFQWLPIALNAGAVMALAASLVPLRARRLSLIVSVLALTVSLATAALQAKSQIYRIGHDRDQHTPLVGVQDFTPPFLGTTKIAQFEVSSRFGLGAWLIGSALALQSAAAWLVGIQNRTLATKAGSSSSAESPTTQLSSATT